MLASTSKKGSKDTSSAHIQSLKYCISQTQAEMQISAKAVRADGDSLLRVNCWLCNWVLVLIEKERTEEDRIWEADGADPDW